MTFTLWRGAELLGELLVEPGWEGASDLSKPEHPSLTAYLIRRRDATPCPALMQYHIPFLPGAVHQTLLDVEVNGGASAGGVRGHGEAKVVRLRRMTPEEAVGVPRERQLAIHDDTGKACVPTLLLVRPLPFFPGADTTKLRGAARRAFADGELWLVAAHFAPAEGAAADVPAL